MLSLFLQITPHFEGIGAIKMVLGTFLKLRIVENQWGSLFPQWGFSKESMG